MGRSSREASLRTRQEVLDSARALFVERGYADVALEDVAARAGVTRGAVYHHFAGKKTLFEAVAATLHEEVAAEVSAAAEAAGPGWPGIRAGCRAFVRAASSPDVRRVLLLDAPPVLGWQHWRSLDARNSRRLLEDGLGELATAGMLRGDPRSAAILLSGAMNEAVLWLAERPEPSAPGDALEVLDLMLQGLEADR